MQIFKDFPIADRLWYKIGGSVKYLLVAQSREDIEQALDYIDKNNIEKVFVCGLGSNIIFTDSYYNGAVLQIARTSFIKPTYVTNEGVVTVFSGDILDNVITFALEHNLTGLEWAGGLPGTVGAGIRGNVGAFGGEIKDSLTEAEVLEINGGKFSVSKLSNAELAFSYRHSFVKESKNRIVLSATFGLTLADHPTLKKAYDVYHANIGYRKAHHPLDYPNCGSVFKNVKKKEDVAKVLEKWPDIADLVQIKWHGKVSMGYIIKRLGFSGYKVGHAQVSDKHANFIINLGNAKAFEVKAIITSIQEKCEEIFDFKPEVEVEIVE